MALQTASEHYDTQKRITLAVLIAVRREWAKVSGDWDTSWRNVRPRAMAVLLAGQLAAARSSAAFVPAALAEQGIEAATAASVNPRAFVGLTASGRPMDGLLDRAVMHARIGGSLDVGGSWLDTLVETTLADTQRATEWVEIAARPRIGWLRMVNTPCCGDCAVLAGKWFAYNEGFERHPNCRCFHVPASQEGRESAQASVPDPSSITGLSLGEREALDNGADLSQVVNSRRGKSKMTTTEGTTRRGVAGRRLQGRQRLTPDAIRELASDRAEAIDLLRKHGYIL